MNKSVNDYFKSFKITFILIVGGDGEDGVLDVLVLVDLGLVQVLVEVGRVVVFVRNTDSDIFGHWKG